MYLLYIVLDIKSKFLDMKKKGYERWARNKNTIRFFNLHTQQKRGKRIFLMRRAKKTFFKFARVL